MVALWRDVSEEQKGKIIETIKNDNSKVPTSAEIHQLISSATKMGYKVGDYQTIVAGLDSPNSFASIGLQALQLHNQEIALDKGRKMGFPDGVIKDQFDNNPTLTATEALANLVDDATKGQILSGSNKGFFSKDIDLEKGGIS